MAEGGAAAQADQALRNVAEILSAAGAAPSDVVKVSVFLKDLGDFPAVNEVYARFFGSWRPARTTVGGLQLPKGALVEIDAVARIP
jgi:2-iminobutanoate/2-iminopropanoate deaminase